MGGTKMKRNDLNYTHILKNAFGLLSPSERKKLLIGMSIQSFSSILDLIGVFFIGIVGSLAVSGVQSATPDSRITSLLNFLNMDNLSFQSQIALLSIFAMLILLTKTVFSIMLTKKILKFLSNVAARVLTDIYREFLQSTPRRMEKKTVQENIYLLTAGLNSIILGIIGTTIALASDFILLSSMILTLFFLDVATAVSTLTIFSMVSLVSLKLLSRKGLKYGTEYGILTVDSENLISESINVFRELRANGRQEYYGLRYEHLRSKMRISQTELQFLPNVSKYIFETTVALGAFMVCGIAFLLKDAAEAVGALALFAAAGSRLAPALMRIQQNIVGIKTNTGLAMEAEQFVASLNLSKHSYETLYPIYSEIFRPAIVFEHCSVTPEDATSPILREINFVINPGEKVAIVGPTGSGKSTLVDLILGLIVPSEGVVTISGLPPSQAIRTWTGSIGYVPQEVKLIQGTLKENVLLGYDSDYKSDSSVLQVLSEVGLKEFTDSLEFGIHSRIDIQNLKASGGQKQLIGVARALISNPKLLLLDEASSSLDGYTESQVLNKIANMRNDVTVVSIAHRLSALKNFDRLIYLQHGEMISEGNISDLRREIPDFDTQLRQMEQDEA